MNNLTVEWIRHGEASLNLFENFAEDEYLDLEINQLPENNNQYNYDIYAKKKEEMKNSQSYSQIIDFLNNKEPIKTNYNNDNGNGNGIIPNDECFKIKSLFRTYVGKLNIMKTDIDKENPDKDKRFDNLTYNEIELQIDYQKFRRELISEEENNYKTMYSEKIKEYIQSLTNMYNETYKSKIGDFEPHDIKMKDFKDIKDATRMIKYMSKGLESIDQFKEEEKVNKTNNPQKICASWLFMPTLSFVGTKQSEFAGKTYLFKKIESYNLILISSTVRTIMTSTISVYTAYKTLGKQPEKPIQIIIAPFINEEYNGGKLIHSDFSNMAIPAGILPDIIEKITTWLQTKYNDIFQYVNINSDQYSEVTKDLDYDTNSSNLEKFLDFVSKYLNPEHKEFSILAYTHGNFINERRDDNNNKYIDGKIFTKNPSGYMFNKVIPFPNNLSTWIESFNYEGNKYVPNYDMTRYDKSYDNQNMKLFPDNLHESKKAFRGSTIRKTLQITPIEELENLFNDNFCSLQKGKLRGDIIDLWFNWIETDEGKKKYNPLILFTQDKIKEHSKTVFSEFLKNKAGKEWLTTEDCKQWLSTEDGKKWLTTEYGKQWLTTEYGKQWLSSVKGLSWLYNNNGKKWKTTNNGKKWLNTKNNLYKLPKTQTVGGYSKKNLKKNKSKSYKKNNRTKVYKKHKTNKKYI